MAISGTWSFPTKVLFGAGRLREIGRSLKGLSVKRPLIVTDAGLAGHDMIATLTDLIAEDGLQSGVFADVKGNPVGANVTAGVAQYLDGGHDAIIAIGGGSALDAAKGIALMARQTDTLTLWDFEERPGNWKKADASLIAPLIAIPTTAGTGSEVGRSAVIVNEETQTKTIIFHPRLLPETVISDPELTVGLPAHITAATGMDAFTHCLEAYCVPVGTRNFHPMADGIAMNGMNMIAKALPRAVEDGSDIEARGDMLAAASMGAVAFQRGLGGVHAIAHSVGALYDTHHGLTNAIVLPYMLRRNEPAIADRVEPIARLLGIPRPDFYGLLDFIISLNARLGIPYTLAALDVPSDQADKVGQKAAEDICALGNPIPLTPEHYTEVFLKAVHGT